MEQMQVSMTPNLTAVDLLALYCDLNNSTGLPWDLPQTPNICCGYKWNSDRWGKEVQYFESKQNVIMSHWTQFKLQILIQMYLTIQIKKYINYMVLVVQL